MRLSRTSVARSAVAAAAVAAAACGKTHERRDLSQLPPDQACQVMAKRTWECKDAMVDTALGLLRKQGGSDEDLAAMRRMLSRPLECQGSALAGLADATRCYDDDCKKLASCYLTMAYGPNGERLVPRVQPRDDGN